MRENSQRQKGGLWVIVAICLLAALLGGLFLKKYTGREPLPEQIAAPAAPEAGLKTAILFFAAPEGGGLVREAREIEPCSGLEPCAEEVLGELINGPMGDLSPTLPETAMYRGISLDRDIMTVDFGREMPEGIVAGSDAELAAVYSVVNSLAINFPEVKQVRFMVEGRQLETLKGHVDLREPLAPDYTMEKSPHMPAGQQDPQRRKQ